MELLVLKKKKLTLNQSWVYALQRTQFGYKDRV